MRDEWYGYLGGTMTTMAFLPQVVKTLRSRDTRSLSFGMYLLFTSGVFLWLLYGIKLHALPMILANGITLLLSLVLLCQVAVEMIWPAIAFTRNFLTYQP